MVKWLHRIFDKLRDEKRQQFFATIDALNAEAGGGNPTVIEADLGTLPLRSGTLLLGDPQSVPSHEHPNLAVENIAADEVTISARLWRYPSGAEKVIGLTLGLGDVAGVDSYRRIGRIGIDSAKLVVADQADLQEHWTETGKDRIGVIPTPRSKTVLKKLKKRFRLETVQVNPIRAEVVGPVSESLEQEIEDWLTSIPEYARHPFLHFYVQTNDSFDRVNRMKNSWGFLPVGNQEMPQMFACGTGRGDGAYGVRCGFAGDTPRVLSIEFIEDDELDDTVDS